MTTEILCLLTVFDKCFRGDEGVGWHFLTLSMWTEVTFELTLSVTGLEAFIKYIISVARNTCTSCIAP